MPAAHPDTRYIRALVENDPILIEEIYTRFAGAAERLVIQRGGNSEDARDVFQDSLMMIRRQALREGFVLTCPFGAYLWCVSRGRWLNELRRRQRHEVTNAEYAGFEQDSHAEHLAEQTLREESRDALFRRCFAELSENCRQVLQLSWSGISMEEVSQQMGITYGYARKHKSECLKKLIEKVRNAPDYPELQHV